jgi:flagellar basal body-associated protein FliL
MEAVMLIVAVVMFVAGAITTMIIHSRASDDAMNRVYTGFQAAGSMLQAMSSDDETSGGEEPLGFSPPDTDGDDD